jgi:flagellin-like protein
LRKLFKSRKALSPVVAAIILIAVTVAVSIAVAAWFGALTFMKTEEEPFLAYEVPAYSIATHVKWWIGNNDLGCWNQSSSIIKLPTEAWLRKPQHNIWLTVTYYKEISPNLFKKIAEVTYDIKVEGNS